MSPQEYLDTSQTPLQFGGAVCGFEIKNSRGEQVYKYKPQWKQWQAHNLPITELFYGGAVFGGKTFYQLHHHALHCMRWGSDANTIIFRRSYDDLKGSYIVELQDKLQWDDGVMGHFKKDEMKMEWNSGGTTWFRHMQRLEDRFKYQSRQFTLISFDELTEFLQAQYEFMFLRLRSPHNPDIFCQMLSSSNPRGQGHDWVHRRFVKGKEPGRVYRQRMPDYRLGDQKVEGYTFTRMFLDAKASDNLEGMKNDKSYLGRMRQGMDPELADAYIGGQWDYFSDSVFPEWDVAKHVCDPFDVPANWKVIRTLDWGYGDPAWYGWMTHDPATDTIYLVAEWYLFDEGPKGGISGLEIAASEQRDMLISREQSYISGNLIRKVWYGVADPSMWAKKGARDDHKSIAQLFNSKSMLFRQADNARLLGAQLFHDRMRRSSKTGQPRFMVFDTCVHFIEMMPKLERSEKNPEDVDKDNKLDHPYDGGRYGLVELDQNPSQPNARPNGVISGESGDDFARIVGETETPEVVHQGTLNYI